MLAIRNQDQVIIEQQSAINQELFNKFINYLDAKPNSIRTYTRNIKQFMSYLKDYSIKNPTRDDVIEYKRYLKEQLELKPTTVTNYISSLKIFFNFTEDAGIYPNIASNVKGAKITKEHKKDYLTARQVKKVLATVDRSTLQGKRDYAILCLMFTGGLRTIEVSRANKEDIRPLGDDRVLYLLGKGREERTEYIKLVNEVEEAIQEYLKTRTDDSEPLFVSTSNNSKGKRISTRTISSIVKEALVTAGYNSDRLTAHSTRHTAVTLALLNGNSLEEVQQFARHRNLETTLIYAHHLDRANNKCEKSVAGAIF